jgi:lysophospholipase L1-like esterase
LTFSGADSVVIASGATVTSDPLEYEVPPLADLAVSIHLSDVPTDVTGHPGSRTTSYLQVGDWVSASALPNAVTTERWYVLAGIDVLPRVAASAVVVLGNSITDGRGSGTNEQNRWPDNLARRLQSDPRTRHVAVLNAGIGGNTVLRGGLGPPALTRLDRDVFAQSGARWLIVLEGVNDIGAARDPGAAARVATDLIAAHQQIIARAHEHGLRVYGGTITPFGGSFYDAPEREAARQTVNRWIRTSGDWDAVIDFDAVLRDPANPTRLLPAVDTGDHLHPNEEGYRLMAGAIDLGLFIH